MLALVFRNDTYPCQFSPRSALYLMRDSTIGGSASANHNLDLTGLFSAELIDATFRDPLSDVAGTFNH